jgi:hypothetical protein
MDQWKALVNAVMNFPIGYNFENYEIGAAVP